MAVKNESRALAIVMITSYSDRPLQTMNLKT